MSTIQLIKVKKLINDEIDKNIETEALCNHIIATYDEPEDELLNDTVEEFFADESNKPLKMKYFYTRNYCCDCGAELDPEALNERYNKWWP